MAGGGGRFEVLGGGLGGWLRPVGSLGLQGFQVLGV